MYRPAVVSTSRAGMRHRLAQRNGYSHTQRTQQTGDELVFVLYPRYAIMQLLSPSIWALRCASYFTISEIITALSHGIESHRLYDRSTARTGAGILARIL